MTVTQIFSIIVSVVVFVIVIRTLMKHKLNESNSILWLLISIMIFVTGLFPGIIDRIAIRLGIYYSPALLFLVASVMLFLIAFKSTMDISKLDARLTELSISFSITNEENHQLKQKIAELEKNNEIA